MYGSSAQCGCACCLAVTYPVPHLSQAVPGIREPYESGSMTDLEYKRCYIWHTLRFVRTKTPLRFGFLEFEHPLCRFGEHAWSQADEDNALRYENELFPRSRRPEEPESVFEDGADEAGRHPLVCSGPQHDPQTNDETVLTSSRCELLQCTGWHACSLCCADRSPLRTRRGFYEDCCSSEKSSSERADKWMRSGSAELGTRSLSHVPWSATYASLHRLQSCSVSW
jgi:hypothetical protein